MIGKSLQPAVEHPPGMLAGTSAREGAIELAAPSEGQDIAMDFRRLRLTLRRRPQELLRGRLRRLGVRRAVELRQVKNGAQVRVAGIVTHGQRTETASGFVFISLEDESGATPRG